MITDKMVEAALLKLDQRAEDDRCGDMVREMLEAADAAAWQTMESAPRELGSEVLLFIPPFAPMQGVRRGDGSWMVGARSIIGRGAPSEPTRWRPLPEPPK